MEIFNYEDTHLALVEQSLLAKGAAVDLASLEQILQEGHVSFVAEGISRLQSTLLCEQKDSYVQQSQRYVVMNHDGYVLPEMNEADTAKGHELMGRALNLYAEMATLKEAYKGRPRPEHYRYGIPAEDARYILPLAMKTNITVAMSADKLCGLFKLFNHPQYGAVFGEFKRKILGHLPLTLGKWLDQRAWDYPEASLVAEFYQPMLGSLGPKEPVQLLGAFADLDLKAGLGALTSTMAKAPSEVLAGWGDDYLAKAQAVANRVMSYGHTSIAEQSRTTVGMIFSLVTYHQQVRHRLTSNYRESFAAILADELRPVVVPPTILGTVFEPGFLALVGEFKAFRAHLEATYDQGQQWAFLLNCDQVKVILGSNARMDQEMLQERICFNAQWEMRQIAVAKLAKLRALSPVLYEKALPSCVYGACGEGQYTCGRAKEMRATYGQPDEVR